LSRGGTRVLEEVHMDGGDLFGVSVDIFPYDSVPDSALLFRSLSAVNRVARAVLLLKVVVAARDRSRPVRAALAVAGVALRPVPVSVLTGARDAVARLFRARGGSDVSMVVSGPRLWRVPESCLTPSQPLQFEGQVFSGPANADALLTAHYGDYMTLPPEEDRRPPHRARSYWRRRETDLA
jgi:lipopolysaccharide cholinephosphotransferase